MVWTRGRVSVVVVEASSLPRAHAELELFPFLGAVVGRAGWSVDLLANGVRGGVANQGGWLVDLLTNGDRVGVASQDGWPMDLSTNGVRVGVVSRVGWPMELRANGSSSTSK